MKQIFFGLFILVSVNSYAYAARNTCSETLFQLGDWSELSSSEAACLNSNIDFVSGIASLCATDKIKISVELSEYLKYKKDYEETLAWYQALPPSQQGAVAKNKVRNAKEAWENLGQKYKIGALVHEVQLAYSNCVIK